MSDDTRLSSYLDFLPAIYREGAEGARPDFLGRFLLGRGRHDLRARQSIQLQNGDPAGEKIGHQ